MGTKRTRPKKIPEIYSKENVEGRDYAPKAITSDTPKKFLRLLDFQKKPKKVKSVKAHTGKKNPLSDLKMESGESLGAFSKRVDTIMGGKSVLKPALVSQKKQKRKAKALEKKEQERIAYEIENAAKDFHKMKDEVKFGEVAMAPPVFTARPKDRAKNKRMLLADLANGSNETNNLKKIRPKTAEEAKAKAKLAKTPAQQRIIEAERVRIVDAYRKLKAGRQTQEQVDSD